MSRGLKPTPYQNPATTIGQPTIVIIPEHKEAASAPKVGGCIEGAWWLGGGVDLPVRTCRIRGPCFTHLMRCCPPLPSPVLQERGIRLFTCHVRRGPPEIQDPMWNSHSKLNCIAACIQVGVACGWPAYTAGDCIYTPEYRPPTRPPAHPPTTARPPIHPCPSPTSQANKAGVDEALMLDPHGFVATCNSVNFFIVRRDGEVWAPTTKYQVGVGGGCSYQVPGGCWRRVDGVECGGGARLSECLYCAEGPGVLRPHHASSCRNSLGGWGLWGGGRCQPAKRLLAVRECHPPDCVLPHRPHLPRAVRPPISPPAHFTSLAIFSAHVPPVAHRYMRQGPSDDPPDPDEPTHPPCPSPPAVAAARHHACQRPAAVRPARHPRPRAGLLPDPGKGNGMERKKEWLEEEQKQFGQVSGGGTHMPRPCQAASTTPCPPVRYSPSPTPLVPPQPPPTAPPPVPRPPPLQVYSAEESFVTGTFAGQIPVTEVGYEGAL